MPNEIHIDYESGNNLYFIRRNAAGQVALSDGSAWENYGDSGHDRDDYDVALTDKDADRYVGDFDSSNNVSAGRYSVQVFLRAGASPADNDPFIGGRGIVWDGTDEIPEKQLAPDGLDAVSKTEPSGVKSGWTFRDWLIWIVKRWENKQILDATAGTLKVRNDADDGDLSEQAVSETGGVQTVGKAT